MATGRNHWTCSPLTPPFPSSHRHGDALVQTPERRHGIVSAVGHLSAGPVASSTCRLPLPLRLHCGITTDVMVDVDRCEALSEDSR